MNLLFVFMYSPLTVPERQVLFPEILPYNHLESIDFNYQAIQSENQMGVALQLENWSL